MVFLDRADAGRQLARALDAWRGKRPIVFAIPRGAVPMGKIVADALDGELDVVLTRKLGAPGNPEFAIGAVDETGWSYVAEYAAQRRRHAGIPRRGDRGRDADDAPPARRVHAGAPAARSGGPRGDRRR